MSQPNPYDELPYGSNAVFEMHPNRMAVVGRLFGLDPAPVRTCRVLDIGCAEGGNAIPVAVSLPQARVIGIDLSERQVAIGNGWISALGLGNVELVRADLSELKGEHGTFDYVCAHGVCSWVAPEVREKLLAACRDLLSPDGVAYVSYNTHPGWSPRLVLREMGLFRARRQRGEARKVAAVRRLLARVSVPTARTGADPYRRLLALQWSLLEGKPDGYIAHDLLEEENHPCWFHEFVAKAAEAGLAYVADARFGAPPASTVLPGVARELGELGAGRLEREQYADFLLDRGFRQSLLCRRERTPLEEPDLSALDRFHVVSCVRPEEPLPDPAPGEPAKFVTGYGAHRTTDDPGLKAALALLWERFPEPVPFPELLGRVATAGREGAQGDPGGLREALLRAHADDVVDLLEHVPAFAAKPGQRPVASPLVRLQAAEAGLAVTSLLHREIVIENGVVHLVLARLDGTRDVAALAREAAEAVVSGGLMTDEDGRTVTDLPRVLAAVEEAMGGILDGAAGSSLLAG